jgi:hypothetical protein
VQALTQCRHGDNQLGSVAEGGIEQTTRRSANCSVARPIHAANGRMPRPEAAKMARCLIGRPVLERDRDWHEDQ